MTVTRDRGGNAVQAGHPAVIQNVLIGSTSTQSTAFQYSTVPFNYTAAPAQATQHIRVAATSNCWISFGTNPTASMGSNSVYLPANSPEYFFVNPNEKVAVIQDTAAGTLNIAELAN